MGLFSYGCSMQKHEWREETDEGKMFYRATYHAGEWALASQLKGEEEWFHYDPIPHDRLVKLREIMWNKYQRGRCPHKLVTKIDRLIEDAD